jgi:H+-translocating NAD(P) transhydrogenase subunit beta
MSGSAIDVWLIVILALALGTLLIIPIGGTDMPVLISMLNVFLGGFGGVTHRAGDVARPVKLGPVGDASFIIPGYGIAVASWSWRI